MNTVLIAAGIYISAQIISFIAGELTEADQDKQKEIDEEIAQIYRRYEKADQADIIKDISQHSERVTARTKELISYLIREAMERETQYGILYEEIRESKRRVISALKAKNVVQTPLRRDSLELLIRQLSEAQEKCYSYIQYLSIYRNDIEVANSSENLLLFSMQLPVDFPYIGKVMWINSSQLLERYIECSVSGGFKVTIRVVDIDLLEKDRHSVVPIMITDGNKKTFTASLEKGAFKAYELINTHLGVHGTVKEIQRNYIILSYLEQLELYLPKNRLIKPDRFPPIHSSLTVYPVKWEYTLSHFTYGNGKKGYPVTVSERKEDATSSLEFKCFPICFTENDLNLFMDYFDKNHLRDYEEEFLIGPVSQDDVALKKGSLLKLQFGDIPLFYIEVDENTDRSDILRYYFRFHHLCTADENTFSADDIFVPFDVTFTPYYEGTSTEIIQQYMEIEDLDDVSALIWDLFEEFRIQNQMQRDREGMGFFFKWENITNQLITVLEQGDGFKASIKMITHENRNSLFADVINVTELEQFIQSFARKTDLITMREWRPEFFVKDEYENRYATMVVDGGKRLRIIGKNVSEVFDNNLKDIELYASNHPYAEYQQKEALRQFRTGKIVNPIIQAACLNSAHIISDIDNEKRLIPFKNDALTSNPSQIKSVEQAFREKNIFLIQGPPGTGKTTVIRELVEQVLETDDHSRILIVSQANVAVDNALSGLIEKYANQTVRCGNGNKISAEFQKLRLQCRCQEYLADLERRKESFDELFYNKWWETIAPEDNSIYSPVLCELIIRNHRLIGATCVGLARRNIGLERTEFDLVIIDEAGKALPAELLIPLIRAKKAIIIGDQKQLPPVINPILYDEEKIDLEERAISENELFCHSFFERLYDNAPDSCKVMLDTQYRMPAVIGTAISELFYNGKLKNGIGTERKEPVLFDSNLSFINFDGEKAYFEIKDKDRQITNLAEAKAVVSLTLNIRKRNPSCSIAIITPYKGQKHLISNMFIRVGRHYKQDKINVDTIDSFQGSEADVVIFCTTRAVKPTLFFKDERRLNVAFSRAKRELIILGRMSYFYKFRKSESCLPSLAAYIKKHGNVIEANKCPMIQGQDLVTKSREILLSIDDISLPSSFYMQEYSSSIIKEKIDEYYTNGDFTSPMTVKKTSAGYILSGSYEQFEAALELGITECLCKII